MDLSNGAVVGQGVSHTQPMKALTVPSTLCWLCSRLDFEWIFTTSMSPKYNGKFYQEYSFSHITSHNKCPLCRIITYIVCKSKSVEEARRHTIILNFQHSHSYVDIKTSLRNYLPKLLVGLKTNDFGCGPFYVSSSFEGMDGLPAQIQLILEPTLGDQTDSPNPLLFGRRVFEYAELTVMKKWLDICKGFHSEKCNPVRHTSIVAKFAIRAVDVENQCITSIDISSQYVALSYVWGGKEVPQLKLQESTFKRLSSLGGLTGGDIPTTISDSIKVCQVLGRRYLWVDALCIMQDDPEEQASQIREMHKIYANADFTIVAAGGPDSWAGLPGISKREVLQHIEVFQERVMLRSFLAGSLPTFQESIMDSGWNTRAWTLQEMYFSKRLLYFTKAQIYFQCEELLRQEDKILESVPAVIDTEIVSSRPPGVAPPPPPPPPPPPYPPPTMIRYLLKHSSRGYKMAPMLRYQDLVQTYSQRRLTNGSDMLNGFAGIMRSFSELMSWEFFYGLPTAYFDAALLFQRRDLRCQLHDMEFPSWSWSGWAERSDPLLMLSSGIRYNEYRYSNFFKENEWYRVLAGQYIKINNSEIAEPPVEWAAWRQSTITELPPVPSELTLPDQERLIVFQASSAFMVVTSGTSQLWSAWWADPACSIALSADGRRLLTQIRETFDLSVICDPKNVTMEVEFVVVASREVEPDIALKSPREAPFELRLMAIETDQSGISKRIDVAEQAVKVTEWLAYKPKVRTVFLL